MTIEKVKQIAREKYGADLTDDMASKYIEKYADKLGRLPDDELDGISGGYGCYESEFWNGKYCEPCGVWCDRNMAGTKWVCPVCGSIYE